MRELPILFSGPMVTALLNTKPNVWPAEPIDESKAFKWTTRRTIKDKDIINGFDIDVDGSVIAYIDQATGDSYPPTVKARYQPGDRLWVRETWKGIKYNNMDGDLSYGVEFKDGSQKHFDFDDNERFHQFGKFALKEGWQSSLFMPKEAARIWLEVMGVRVERLQEITYDDCLREGMWNCGTDVNTLAAFQDLWQNLNAKRGFGWNANPYVWVYELKRVEEKSCDEQNGMLSFPLGLVYEALERAIKAEAEVERLKEEAHQDIEWLYKEYVLEADVNLSQDAIDLKRKLRDMVCKELQAENAQLRKVVDAARGIFLGEGEHLCSEFEDAMDQLRQALAELDKEGE